MVYAWDEDNRSDVAGRDQGILATSFLKALEIHMIKKIMMEMALLMKAEIME